MRKVRFQIKRMHCKFCAYLEEEAKKLEVIVEQGLTLISKSGIIYNKSKID